jgi:periplasmic divalent cation tolerance protein
MDKAVVVLCTVPTDFDAGGLADDLVTRSLAACVQIGPPVSSVYKWKGEVERSEERLLLIKSTSARFAALEAAIKDLHPYDVPEIVALEVSEGHAPYLAWISEMTAT